MRVWGYARYNKNGELFVFELASLSNECFVVTKNGKFLFSAEKRVDARDLIDNYCDNNGLFSVPPYYASLA